MLQSDEVAYIRKITYWTNGSIVNTYTSNEIRHFQQKEADSTIQYGEFGE